MKAAYVGPRSILNWYGILDCNKVTDLIVSGRDLALDATILKQFKDRKIYIHLYLPYPQIKKSKFFILPLNWFDSITHTNKEYSRECWQHHNRKIVEDSDLIIVNRRPHAIIQEAQKQRKPVLHLCHILPLTAPPPPPLQNFSSFF